MEFDYYAPTMGQNGTLYAILPPMVYLIVSTLYKLYCD